MCGGRRGCGCVVSVLHAVVLHQHNPHLSVSTARCCLCSRYGGGVCCACLHDRPRAMPPFRPATLRKRSSTFLQPSIWTPPTTCCTATAALPRCAFVGAMWLACMGGGGGGRGKGAHAKQGAGRLRCRTFCTAHTSMLRRHAPHTYTVLRRAAACLKCHCNNLQMACLRHCNRPA